MNPAVSYLRKSVGGKERRCPCTSRDDVEQKTLNAFVAEPLVGVRLLLSQQNINQPSLVTRAVRLLATETATLVWIVIVTKSNIIIGFVGNLGFLS